MSKQPFTIRKTKFLILIVFFDDQNLWFIKYDTMLSFSYHFYDFSIIIYFFLSVLITKYVINWLCVVIKLHFINKMSIFDTVIEESLSLLLTKKSHILLLGNKNRSYKSVATSLKRLRKMCNKISNNVDIRKITKNYYIFIFFWISRKTTFT